MSPQVLRPTLAHLALAVAALTFAGCGGGGSSSRDTPAPAPVFQTTVSGAAQKGPFIVGSSVTINSLSETGENSGTTIVTQTTDDLGNFSFTSDEQGLVQISVDGFFRNEITGELSAGQITLRAIHAVDASSEQTAHVNIMTHATGGRIRRLMENGDISFQAARDQAELEFLSLFSEVIPNTAESEFTSLTIFGDQTTQASSYLLAMSSVVYQYSIAQSNLNATSPEAELSRWLNELEADFADDGDLDFSIAALREQIPLLNPAEIANNLASWTELNPDLVSADINAFLDTDLDGQFNDVDLDDDNDGTSDADDLMPHLPGFSAQDTNITTAEDTPVTIDLSSNNPSGGSINFSIIQEPSNGTLTGFYPEFVYSPNPNYFGTDTFQYRLDQGNIVSNIISVGLTITSVTDTPTISGNPATEVKANETYTFTPTISNIDSVDLIFDVSNLPAWANFDTTTGTLAGLPLNSDAGDYNDILITATSGSASLSLDPFQVIVITNPWVQIANMPTTRHSLSVSLSGTKLYAIGGVSDRVSASVEEYDLVSNEWRTLTDLQIARSGHTSHAIGNQIYVIGGGEPGETDSVEAYSISSDSWSTKTSMSIAREAHCSSQLNGLVYAFGGFTEDGDPALTHIESTETAEVYDPQTDSWSALAPMPVKNWGMSCVVVNDLIYVLGGAGNELGFWIYDPLTDVWDLGGEMPVGRRYSAASGFVDGKIHLISGYFDASTADSYAFDPGLNQWNALTPPPYSLTRSGFATYEGRIYLFGNNSNGSSTDTGLVYDPSLESN